MQIKNKHDNKASISERGKTKILFIHHAAGWGGAPINMINIINSLDQNLFDVKVLLIKNSVVADKFKENNINYTIAASTFYKIYYQYLTHSEAGYIKWYQAYKFLKLSILWLLSRYFFAQCELAKHDYDIAHLNSSVLTDWLAPAKQRGKVIIHVQEPFRKGKFDVLRPVFRSQMRKHADHIIAISQDNARRVNLPDKTTVVYNYAETPKYEPSKNSYSSKKVLYLGGSARIKGYFTMVDALDFLDNDVSVYFGGYYHTTNIRRSIKEIIKNTVRHFIRRKYINAYKKINNHPNAVVIGLTQKVNNYFNKVCCLVSPFSAPHFARPIIEASLHRKPVIGSDVEGMDEIIEHAVTGLIVPKNNAQALAKAINELVADDHKAKCFGEAGFVIARQKFTNNNVSQIEQVYDEILSDSKTLVIPKK